MKVSNPVKSSLDKITPNRVAVEAIEVDGFSPKRSINIGAVGSILFQVAPLRAKAVVDNVQDHRQPMLVAVIDQALKSSRSLRKRIGSRTCSHRCSPKLRIPGSCTNQKKLHVDKTHLSHVLAQSGYYSLEAERPISCRRDPHPRAALFL